MQHVPTEDELTQVEPSEPEVAIAYRLLGPIPYSMSPVRYVARMLGAYRERLLEPLEQLAQQLPPREAAQLRACMERARGRL